MLDLRMPVRYNTFTSELLWFLWGLHPSRIQLVVIFPGHVLDVPGQPKVLGKGEHFVFLVYLPRGIVMGLENTDLDSCIVCYRYHSASRSRIRKLVIEESFRTGATTFEIKKTLCKNHRHIGFSARSHTVGEAGIPLDATEEGDSSHIPLLPTFIKSATHIRPDHKDASVRRHWKWMITQFFKKK